MIGESFCMFRVCFSSYRFIIDAIRITTFNEIRPMCRHRFFNNYTTARILKLYFLKVYINTIMYEYMKAHTVFAALLCIFYNTFYYWQGAMTIIIINSKKPMVIGKDT